MNPLFQDKTSDSELDEEIRATQVKASPAYERERELAKEPVRLTKSAAARLAKLDKEIGSKLDKSNWDDVLIAFSKSGVPAVIAEETELDIAQVSYLLDYGIPRLGLPSIREYTHEQAVAIRSQAEVRQELSKTDVRVAVQERVAQEAANVQIGMQTLSYVNEIVNRFAQELLQAAAQNGMENFLPEGKVTPKHIEALVEIQNKLVAAAEKMIKLNRLIAGQPTDIVRQQVMAVFATATLEELQEAERAGHIPASVLRRLPTGDAADPSPKKE